MYMYEITATGYQLIIFTDMYRECNISNNKIPLYKKE